VKAMYENETISIYNVCRKRQKRMASRCSFFKNEVAVKIEYNKLTFWIPTIDYNGKTRKLTLHKKGYYYMEIVCEYPIGKYKINEEESNEDCLVVYINK
jgi:hypothetical protein